MHPNEVSHPTSGSEGESYPVSERGETAMNSLFFSAPDLEVSSLFPSPHLDCIHQGQENLLSCRLSRQICLGVHEEGGGLVRTGLMAQAIFSGPGPGSRCLRLRALPSLERLSVETG